MHHQYSKEDLEFTRQFERCESPAGEFDHPSHVRLAYVYLCQYKTSDVYEKIRSALLAYLNHHGIDPEKYHDTLTQAWLLAVRHFMESSPPCSSANGFMAANPKILDSSIMMTHYTESHLFSDEARAKFVEPDIESIPRYDQ